MIIKDHIKTGKRLGRKFQIEAESSFICIWRCSIVLVFLENFSTLHSKPSTYRDVFAYAKRKTRSVILYLYI